MLTYEERIRFVRTMCDEKVLEEDCPVDYLDFDTPFITTNGIDMGNPGTKGSLTLLALIAEQEASDLASKITNSFDFFNEEPNSFWISHANLAQTYGSHAYDTVYHRAAKEGLYEPNYREYNPKSFGQVEVKQPSVFSTAGDDQIAGGTREKLSLITESHERNHMVVSKEKDLVSPLLWIYCGRYALRTDNNRLRSHLLDDYNSHMLVDDLMVRLFSPATKAQESSNEPNPAIGKAKVLSERNAHLPEDWHVIRDRLVNHRFKQRMHKHLPRTTNGSIDPIVELPLQFGGLGLGPVTDSCLLSLSGFHLTLINDLLKGDIDTRLKKALQSMMKDRFARGLSFEPTVLDEAWESMTTGLKPTPSVLSTTWHQEGLPDEGYPSYFAKRRKLGSLKYHGTREIKELFRRSMIQSDLLIREDVTKGWSHAEWPARRAAFERSLKTLYELRFLEGRYEHDPMDLDLNDLRDQLNKLTHEDLKALIFEEDEFFHESMTVIDDNGNERQPIREILEQLPTLELPSIASWFLKPVSDADQT